MKKIEIEDDLYAFIASQTKHIGESASQILRRLLIANGAENLSAMPDNQVSLPAVDDVQSPCSTPSEQTVQPVSQVDAPLNADDDALLQRVNSKALTQFDKRVDQFLFILQQTFVLQPDNFYRVESIKGKNRKYFATNKEALLESGSSTNPKCIPDSGYWVVTNNNTAKKSAMIAQVLQILGYSDKVVETVTEAFSAQ